MGQVKQLPNATRRSPAGWPIRPVGGGDKCGEIARWLFPSMEQRSLPELISNNADAYRWVYAVATFLLEDLRMEEKSLHLADERARLEGIVDLASKLRSKIRAYEGATGHLAHVAASTGFLKLMALPGGIAYERVAPHEILGRPLDELEKRAEAALAELEKIGRPGRDKDKLSTRVYGSPRKALAVRCAILLVAARGLKGAPISYGGPVAELSERIWEFATGQRLNSDFSRLAKEAAKVAREEGESGRKRLRRDARQAEKLSLVP